MGFFLLLRMSSKMARKVLWQASVTYGSPYYFGRRYKNHTVVDEAGRAQTKGKRNASAVSRHESLPVPSLSLLPGYCVIRWYA